MISFQPLRQLIKDRGISSYYLRNKCDIYNLDSKTIYRLMHDESVSTNTLNSLCHIFDCDLSEIMTFIPDNITSQNYTQKEIHNEHDKK